MEKVEIDKRDMVDFSNRMSTAVQIGNSIGLGRDDMSILLFVLMGDRKEGNLNEILKKVKLPRAKATYDRDKLRKYCTMLAERMKELDNYGILSIDKHELLRMSKNKEYITIFGMQVLPNVYADIYRILSVNPDYAISTFLGIYEALGKILEFTGAKE